MTGKQYREIMDKVVISQEKIDETSKILKRNVHERKQSVRKNRSGWDHCHLILASGVVCTLLIIMTSVFGIIDTNNEFKETVQLAEGKLVFCPIDSPPASGAKIVTPNGKQMAWTLKQINEYMGKNVELEYIPKILTENDLDEPKYVYIDEDGAVTYDTITYSYSEKQDDPEIESAWLTVTIARGKMPISDTVIIGETTSMSTLKGVELSIVSFDKTIFAASFMYGGIGYDIRASHISQEDFIKVLSSIIKY